MFKTSFQWFVDFSTSTDKLQIVQFSAGGNKVRERLAPLFGHYRKYKLGSIHVKLTPSATLPVDPTGLSYEVGEQTVDPRDMFNPGLFRHTNGEDIFVPDDNTLASEESMNLYYATMLDKRWGKFHLQKGLRISAFPKWYGVATTCQNMFPGIRNYPTAGTGNKLDGGMRHDPFISLTGVETGSSDMALFQNGQRIPMGWMPTGASLKDEFGLLNGTTGSVFVGYKFTINRDGTPYKEFFTPDTTEEQANIFLEEFKAQYPTYTWTMTTTQVSRSTASLDAGAVFGPIPEIPDLITLVLPKAIKTKFYYRCYVKEDVYFADPVTCFNAIDNAGSPIVPMDVFTRSQLAATSPMYPLMPTREVDGGKHPLNDGESFL